jgi:hypothetical protein
MSGFRRGKRTARGLTRELQPLNGTEWNKQLTGQVESPQVKPDKDDRRGTSGHVCAIAFGVDTPVMVSQGVILQYDRKITK